MNFIWQVADDTLRVRGAFKAHEYGDVILPFVVLRRLDLVLEPKKDEVIRQFEQSLMARNCFSVYGYSDRL